MVTAARILVSGLLCGVCACSQAAAPAAEAASPSKARGVVIAQIVTHDSKVAILGRSPQQPDLRVVVRKLDGTIVADGITVDELASLAPDLHTVITSSFAATSTSTSYVDATLDLAHVN